MLADDMLKSNSGLFAKKDETSFVNLKPAIIYFLILKDITWTEQRIFELDDFLGADVMTGVEAR